MTKNQYSDIWTYIKLYRISCIQNACEFRVRVARLGLKLAQKDLQRAQWRCGVHWLDEIDLRLARYRVAKAEAEIVNAEADLAAAIERITHG